MRCFSSGKLGILEKWLFIFLASLLSCPLSQFFYFEPEGFSLLWIPNAITVGLATVLAMPEHDTIPAPASNTKYLFAVMQSDSFKERVILSIAGFLGILSFNLWMPIPVSSAVNWAIINYVEILVSLVLLAIFAPHRNPLQSMAGVLCLIAYIPLLGCGAAGALSAIEQSAIYGESLLSVFSDWWRSDFSGMLLGLPLIFALSDSRLYQKIKLTEVFFSVVLLLIAVWLFIDTGILDQYWNRVPTIICPPLVIASVFIRQSLLVVIGTLINLVALYGTFNKMGVFSFYGPNMQAHLYAAQFFIWAVTAVVTWCSAAFEELKIKRVAAEQATAAKSIFLATMSHEVRTPMTAIIGLAEQSLDSSRLNKKDKESLSIIHESATSLLRILNDILDFAKLEKGKVLIQYESSNLVHMLTDLSKSFAPLIKNANIKFELDIDSQIPQHLICDLGRLRQVMTNLIGNAIKFTPAHGMVVLRAVQKSLQEDMVTILISVSDNGQGIPAFELERIFEPFEQGESRFVMPHNGSGLGGTGLGLSISRNLVAAMGSTLAVSSVENKGTEFSFTLVLQIDRSQVSIQNKFVEQELPPGLRVLVAEDNSVNQTLLRNILQNWGCEVEVVGNGLLAVERVRQARFDLILMDISMPNVSGPDATKRIRCFELEKNWHTPIIAVTAHALRGDREEFLSYGMDGYIAKPFEKAELRRVLIAALNNSNKF